MARFWTRSSRTRLRVLLTVAACGLCISVAEATSAQDGGVARLDDADEALAARILREGAFLPSAIGAMRQLASGHWAFVFDRDPVSGSALPPMIVLPSINLAAMEQLAESREQEIRFEISGQVFVFENRNYLLLTRHEVVGAESEAEAAQEADQQRPPDVLELAPDDDEPSVEELIQFLEDAAPARSEPTVRQAPADGARSALLREGTLLSMRRGRVRRAASGGWIFHVDNDVEDQGAPPPMQLLPCRNLEGLKDIVERYGEELSFRLSGRVFVYDGANYLLPTLFAVDVRPEGNLVLGQ